MSSGIDQISLRTRQRADGTTFDIIRVWIAQIPLETAHDAHTERVMRRVAREQGIDFDDRREKDRQTKGSPDGR